MYSWQCLVLGWLGFGSQAGNQDDNWERELPVAPVSSGSFIFLDGLSLWPSILRLPPDIQSSKSLDLVAIGMIVVAVNWNSGSSHTNRGQRLLQEMKNHLVCINYIFFTLIGTPFIHHQWRSLTDVGTPPTWEKAVTYLLEPPDFGNLRDGCDLSQLQLPNQIFGILPLCIKITQGHQKCDRSHRDTRWIGGLSHQRSNLSHLCYPLQKVVICACSNTGFEWHEVANYPAN